tara:strand:+ start:9789 stop:10835 length:1047 start_codon:yes stop_codon:yes gene_type:complete
MITQIKEAQGISAIVCSYNGAERMESTLKAIAKQSKLDEFEIEVIVVDNNSTDQTFEISQSLFSELNLKGEVLREVKQGKRFALDLGIRRASYEIVAIIDDDNIVYQDYFSKIYMVFYSQPTVGFCGTATELVTDLERVPKWWPDHQKLYAVGSQYSSNGFIDEMSGATVWGAGMAFRRRIWFDAYGRYKSSLLGRNSINLVAGEDSELCFIAILMGWRGYYLAEEYIGHYMPASRLTEDYLLRLSRSMGAGGIKNKVLSEEWTIRTQKQLSWFYLASRRSKRFLIAMYCIKSNYFFIRAMLARSGPKRIECRVREAAFRGSLDAINEMSERDLWSFPLTGTTDKELR